LPKIKNQSKNNIKNQKLVSIKSDLYKNKNEKCKIKEKAQKTFVDKL